MFRLLENLFNLTLGTVNTVILSNYSENAVAAVGTANQLISMYMTFFSVIAMGATAVTSNFLGAQRLQDARKATTAAIFFCATAGGVLGILFCFLHNPMLTFMNLNPEIFDESAAYYNIRSLFLVIPALTAVLNAVMRCYGITRPGVYSGFLSNVINLGGNILVLRIVKDDLRAIIIGIGISCVIGQFVGLLSSVCIFMRNKVRLQRLDSFSEAASYIKKILQIGLPGGMSTVGYTISQTITTSFIAVLGTSVLSAKIYFSTIASYCYICSNSLGNANSILIGRLCGAARYEDATRLNRQLHWITSAINLISSLLVLFFRIQILSLFTKQEEIFAMSLTIFLIDIIIEQARAVSQIYEYALRSTGDTFVSMVGILCSSWINGVGMAYLFAILLGLGLPGIWLGFALLWMRLHVLSLPGDAGNQKDG